MLGHVSVDAKSNESPAARTLVAALESDGAVLPPDAMHTQTDTATLVREAGGDYMFTVTANMPILHGKLKKLPGKGTPRHPADHDRARPTRDPHDHRHRCAGVDRVSRRRPSRPAGWDNIAAGLRHHARHPDHAVLLALT